MRFGDVWQAPRPPDEENPNFEHELAERFRLCQREFNSPRSAVLGAAARWIEFTVYGKDGYQYLVRVSR